MKKFTLTFTILCAFCALAYSGTERYSGKEEVLQPGPPPCEWYRANEWDFMIWGFYGWSGNPDTNHYGTLDEIGDEFVRENGVFVDIGPVHEDRFLGRDGAWGGGADIKYFFNKYWALGIEGWVADANDNSGGAGLGTLTVRYPIGCSRFAPYAYGGFGVFGGGSHTSRFFFNFEDAQEDEIEFTEDRTTANPHVEPLGQFGGGLEVRITKHVGVMGDFTWNWLSGPSNNFGMSRFGVTLSY